MSDSDGPDKSQGEADGARRLTRPLSLVSAVVGDLIHRVARGEFQSAEPLVAETKLGQDYGVSRPVIREALRTLADKGLITIRHGRGTVVNEREEWDLVDPEVLSALVAQDRSPEVLSQLVHVRAAVEAELARAATGNMSDADRGQLRTLFGELEAYQNDIARYQPTDRAFHDHIMRCSNNPFGRVIVRKVSAWSRAAPRPLGYDLREVAVSLAGHRRIHEAIQARDALAAGEAMRTHILDAWAERLRIGNL
jgi:GntR family galactonate operon transcriptional repressor